MATLRSYFILLAFQFIGGVLGKAAHLPLPGPVLGMILLAVWYIVRRSPPDPHINRASGTLLNWMGLLFVPAGVGIVANFGLLRSAWLPVSVALVGSTLFTLLVTAGVMHRLTRGTP